MGHETSICTHLYVGVGRVRLTGCIAVCKLLVLGMGRGSAVEEVFVIL